MPEPERARWRDLVERRLPEAAREVRADWPVRLDHCFARILLDNTCNGPWRESVPAPAWANMPLDALRAAIDLGEAVLAGRADLLWLNRRSLSLRGKAVRPGGDVPPPPESLSGDGFHLRRWTPEATDALVALNADPEVMQGFPATRDAEASRREVRAFEGRFRADGFGPWALEVPGEGFVGLVGAARLMRCMPFPGGERPGATVELVWRLARAAWGGASRAGGARLARADLFGRCGIAEVVAFTAEANRPSRRVMERIGMRPAGGFRHPALPDPHPLALHLLYRSCAADGMNPEGLAQ